MVSGCESNHLIGQKTLVGKAIWMAKDQIELLRATFEATLDAQETLRKLLDGLIAINRPIEDAEERADFFNLLSHSTLGLGFNFPFFLNLPNEGKFYEADNLEYVGRWLSYQGNYPFGLKAVSGSMMPKLSISLYWENLRDSLFRVFPIALERAIRMSKEQDASGKMQGYIID